MTQPARPQPEQPLRVRFSRALPVYMLTVPIFITVLTASFGDAEVVAGVAVLTLFFVVIGLIFVLKPKYDGALPDDWREASIKETDSGFIVSWYAQYWNEMSPRNMPSLWLTPVWSMYAIVTCLPLLAVVHDLAYDANGPLEDAMSAALVSVFSFSMLISVMALGVIVVKRFAPSRVWFLREGVYYDPAPSGLGHFRLAPDQGYFGHGNLTILRRSIGEITVDRDAIVISAPPFLGFIPLHMCIPHVTPEVVARVSQ